MDRREIVHRVSGHTLLAVVLAAVPAAPVPASPRAARPLPLFVKGAVKRSVALAREKLQTDECRAIYTDFSDLEGRPLAERLELIGITASDHLVHLQWVNGAEHPTCQSSAIYFATVVGSLRIYVCPDQFSRYAVREPHKAAGLVLHEHLHSLGLGENPPTSQEISQRVWARCDR